MWLTYTILELEYRYWGDSNRNHQDLRFGQYLCSEYWGVPSEVFHIEDKRLVYDTLLEIIYDTQRK